MQTVKLAMRDGDPSANSVLPRFSLPTRMSIKWALSMLESVAAIGSTSSAKTCSLEVAVSDEMIRRDSGNLGFSFTVL